MRLEAIAPYDFYLSLDATDTLPHPDMEDEVAEYGLPCPLALSTREVLVVARFVGDDPEAPYFELELPNQDDLSAPEQEEVRGFLGRMLGLDLKNEAFYEATHGDPVLGPLIEAYHGYVRLSTPSLYEAAVREIVFSNIAHAPTRQRMLQGVKERWGAQFDWRGKTYATTPRPSVLRDADPEAFKELKVSRRKGEYIVGLAKMFDEGELLEPELEAMGHHEFFDTMVGIRGIGPSIAQILMLGRHRPDAALIPVDKKGQEWGIRRFVLPMYGLDADELTQQQSDEALLAWTGFESRACHLTYLEQRMARLEGRA
ncbi:MAG: hypothetical protein AAGI01_08720 [Myxococcota bacterium]